MRWISVLAVAFAASSAVAKVQVATTTTDLEALVQAVAADQVDVFSVAKGTQDPHQIEAKPSFMVKFRGADLVVSQGLELESAWLTPLIQGARNPKIANGSKGQLELGPLLNPIEVATGSVSRAEGDVHPAGNPHFQLDPLRMGRAASALAERLGELDVAHKDLYTANAAKFSKSMEDKQKEWQERLNRTGIKEVVTYHKTFSYFLDRFGIKSTLQLEPKPGIPPTAGHIMDVIEQMKARKIKLVLIENYFDNSIRHKLESEVPGVKVATVPVSVGGLPNIKTNQDLIETLVKAVEEAAK